MPTTDFTVELHLECLRYPLGSEAQRELVQLWRTEWSRTDYDWLEAMNGDYSENLVIMSVLARRLGEPVATATIQFHRQRPEVAVLGSVLTRRDQRGVGIGSRVVAAACEEARAAGCALCLLGTTRSPRNVYSRYGFRWLNGIVMSRLFGDVDVAALHFSPGQSAQVRAAHWGDLPGLTLLTAQPLETACLDFCRGFLSSRFSPADRCLSTFPVLWYDTVPRGGALLVLTGEEPGRVLGFASVTRGPGSGRRRTATLDFCAHDAYRFRQPDLLASALDFCGASGIGHVEARVAAIDEGKIACLCASGFSERARFPAALEFNNGPAVAVLFGRIL